WTPTGNGSWPGVAPGMAGELVGGYQAPVNLMGRHEPQGRRPVGRRRHQARIAAPHAGDAVAPVAAVGSGAAGRPIGAVAAFPAAALRRSFGRIVTGPAAGWIIPAIAQPGPQPLQPAVGAGPRRPVGMARPLPRQGAAGCLHGPAARAVQAAHTAARLVSAGGCSP